VLAIAAAAVLCGREGYKGIWDWAKALGPKGRERFRCRYVKGSFHSMFKFLTLENQQENR